METDRSCTQSSSSSSQPQLSPKKSPKKNSKYSKFKQNNNNSSPKKVQSDPSSPSKYTQNDPISTTMKPSTAPGTSPNSPCSDPVPSCEPSNNPFVSALQIHLNRPSPEPPQETAAVSQPSASVVESLKITVSNNSSVPQRIVQNEVIQPQKVFVNNAQPQKDQNVIQPQKVQNEIQPQKVQNVIHPPKVQNEIQPQKVQNVIHPPKVQNVIQPQRIFSNDVNQQQRVHKDVTQTQGTEHETSTPRQIQFRFPVSRLYQNENAQQKQSGFRKGSQPFQPYQSSRQPDMRAPQVPNNEEEYLNGEAYYQQQRANWRQRRQIDEEQDTNKKVIVTGFPAFTKPDELVRKMSQFGTARVEVCRNRVAVVVFNTEAEVSAAINGSETVPVYGSILSIYKYTNNRHVHDMIRSNRKVFKHEHKGPPVPSPDEIDLSGDFMEQIQNIEDAIRLTQEEVENINLLFEDIEKYMRMIFPTCSAVPFGSITTGLGIKSSDADCFLALREGAGAAQHGAQFVGRAARLLRLYPAVFADLVPIPRANTPIVKFLHLPTNVNCDLNSKTALGVQNSRLIGHLLRHDPRLGSCALLLKYWARVQQLSGTGRLTNYALLLLLIFYLQRSLLPPVYRLQSEAHSYKVEIWEAGFDSSPLPYMREVPPLRDLLGGFFLYYAGFDFEELVVCPFLGRPLRKAELESNVLPAQFALYLCNVAERLALPVRTACALCVQDPFELSHNVASAVSARLAADIRAHIRLAATAYTQQEKTAGDFLRTILTTRPPSPSCLSDSRGSTRLSLPARLLHELAPAAAWRDVLRRVVLHDIFRDMLFVELIRRASVSRDKDIDLEVYVGNLKRPIWKRGNMHGHGTTAADMLQWHREATARVVNNPQIADVTVPFEVELGFRTKPARGFTITTIPLSGGDEGAFRAFRQFTHTFIHRWHREMFKPHLKKHPPEEDKDENSPGTPKNTSPKRKSPKKVRRGIRRSSHKAELDLNSKSVPPIETVAFVNSNHKDLSESVAAISLVDSSAQNSESDSDSEEET